MTAPATVSVGEVPRDDVLRAVQRILGGTFDDQAHMFLDDRDLTVRVVREEITAAFPWAVDVFAPPAQLERTADDVADRLAAETGWRVRVDEDA